MKNRASSLVCLFMRATSRYARTPASWRWKAISPLPSTICRRDTCGRPGSSQWSSRAVRSRMSPFSLQSANRRVPGSETDSPTNANAYYRNNIAGSLTLLETLRDRGIDQFVSCRARAPLMAFSKSPDRRDVDTSPDQSLMAPRSLWSSACSPISIRPTGCGT
jgi:hypothetical protein